MDYERMVHTLVEVTTRLTDMESRLAEAESGLRYVEMELEINELKRNSWIADLDKREYIREVHDGWQETEKRRRVVA